MDNQNRKRKEYPDHKKIITGLAITVVLTLVDVYLSVMTADFNLAHLFAFIENEHLRIAVLALFQMALLGSSYGIVYFAISLVYKIYIYSVALIRYYQSTNLTHFTIYSYIICFYGVFVNKMQE